MKFPGCRTLLSGAGSGIGRSLALILAARGARLALVGRNAGRLDATVRAIRAAGGEACAIVHDLGDPGGHGQLADAAAAALGGIDLLVNNAGVSSFSEFAGESPAAIEDLLGTNITAPMLLTRAVLPAMLATGTRTHRQCRIDPRLNRLSGAYHRLRPRVMEKVQLWCLGSPFS